jgi:hypothetical protein
MMMLEHNMFASERHTMSAEDLAKFYTENGWLSEYALDCGYIERIDHNNQWLSLWKEGCYHVRWHNFETDTRILWESFDTVEEARKFFTKQAEIMESM